MTAGGQQEESNSDNGGPGEANGGQQTQIETKEARFDVVSGLTKTAEDVWVEARLLDSSRETPPILPFSTTAGSSKSQAPIRRATCDLPSLHCLTENRYDCHSLPPSSHHSSCYAFEQTKDQFGRNWVAGMVRGGGCSVLPDKSIDLIELQTESESGGIATGGVVAGAEGPVQCSSACQSNNKKWLFSRHKCKSLDCTNKTPQVFHKPVISCLSTTESFQKLKNQKTSSNPMLEANSGGISSVYTTTGGATTLAMGKPDPKFPRSNSVTGEPLESFESTSKEEDFRARSFSLTPTVNLAIFETESSSEDEDHLHQDSNTFLSRGEERQTLDTFYMPTVSVPLLPQTMSCSPSAAQLSLASSMTDSGASTCKICHMTSKDGDPLISPCRCSGTMQFIHCGCLMRWLEISSKKSRKPPSCELCQYQYHWHKKFKVRHWQFPHCSRHDKILHVLFFISVMIMIACATITIMCFKQDKGTKVDPDRTELTESEIVTLVCGVLFFLAFFVAMYVEVKARNTIYKLLVRFVYLNQQWYIDEYEKKESAPVSV